MTLPRAEAFYRDPDSRLCQGDIVASVPHIHLKPPLTVLRPAATKDGHMLKPFAYADPAPDAESGAGLSLGGYKFAKGEPEQVTAACHLARGIVLTHGCEIDKDSKHRLVALIRPLGPLPEDAQQTIREHRNFSAFHLPALPGILEESYVDFRRLTCIDPRFVDAGSRLTSLTDDGLKALLMQFFLFITRVEPKNLAPLLDAIAPAHE